MNNLLQAARTGDLQSVQTLLNELSDPATRLYAANQALCAPSLSLPVAQYLLRQERADPTGSRGAQALSNAIRMTGGFDLIEASSPLVSCVMACCWTSFCSCCCYSFALCSYFLTPAQAPVAYCNLF